LFLLLLLLPLLFMLFWAGAHCEPVPQCRRQGETLFAIAAAAAAAFAALLGFAVRALVRWAAMRGHDPERAGPPPLWAGAVGAAFALLAAAVAAQMFFF
jgi:cation transporter-like permease